MFQHDRTVGHKELDVPELPSLLNIWELRISCSVSCFQRLGHFFYYLRFWRFSENGTWLCQAEHPNVARSWKVNHFCNTKFAM
jgi:hypothetical protein